MKRARTPTPSKRGWKPILLARGLITALAGVMFGAGSVAAHPRPPEVSTSIDRVARIRMLCSKTTVTSLAPIRP